MSAGSRLKRRCARESWLVLGLLGLLGSVAACEHDLTTDAFVTVDDGGVDGASIDGAPAAPDLGPLRCVPTPDPVCSPDRWCWENPLPAGNSMAAIDGSGNQDLWIGGEGGTLVHYDGQRFTGVSGQVNGEIVAVHQIAPGEVWAFSSDGAILRGDARGLRVVASYPVSPPVTWSISATSNNSIFAMVGPSLVGPLNRSRLFKWDGVSWRELPGPESAGQLEAIRALDGERLFAVFYGLVRYFDGATWSAPMALGKNTYIHALWGGGGEDVWAGGASYTGRPMPDDFVAALFRWDGRQWLASTAPRAYSIVSLAGSGRPDLWAATWVLPGYYDPTGLARYDGVRWNAVVAPEDNPFYLSSLWVSRDEEVFAAGWPALHRLDGNRWSPLGCGALWMTITRIAGTRPDALWALGQPYRLDDTPSPSNLLHFDGSAWTISATGAVLQCLTTSAPDDVWAAGSDVRHYDGQRWSITDVPDGGTVHALWQRGRDDVLAATDSSLLHFDGSRWSRLAGAPDWYPDWYFATALWDDGAGAIWWIDQLGQAARFDGRKWTQLNAEEPVYDTSYVQTAFFGRAPDDAWLARWVQPFEAGPVLTVFHWDGKDLVTVAEKYLEAGVSGIWSGEKNRAWIVSPLAIYRCDGQSMQEVPVGGPPDARGPGGYQAIAGLAADDIWATTVHGGILHYDGVSWTRQRSGAGGWLNLTAIWAHPDATVVAGDGAAILRQRRR